MNKKLSGALVLVFAFFGTSIFAGNTNGQEQVRMQSPFYYLETLAPSQQSVPFEETHLYKKQNRVITGSSDRTVSSVQIGSAGNLFTIINNEVRSLAANNDINSVVFIHRSNPEEFPNDNVGQYRYDVSTNGGSSWTSDVGVVNPSGNNNDLACRYPNVAIHNPQGNTDPNNAYMGYKGAWLPFGAGGTWDGTVAGTARLDNDPSTFSETYYGYNNNDVLIAAGMSNGSQGVFWAVDRASQDGANTDGIIIYQGFWNPISNDINWVVNDIIFPNFYQSQGNSQVTAVNMAFDPSGQYGWIVMTGDVSTNGRGVMNPIFYRTQDGGNTWSGPIELHLENFPNILDKLGGDPALTPTTGFDSGIAVDINGNPHATFIVGDGNDYAITTGQGADLALYNFTYFSNATSGCRWQAIKIADVETFRGQMTADVSEDNRPQVSRSPDGTKIFYGWGDSDPNLTGGTNDLPNLHVRGYDVVTGLATPIVNFTEGDQVWDGGALFTLFSTTTLVSGSTYTIPTVFAELNPFTGSDADPTNFHYIQNIEFSDSDFTEDITPPVITLNGQSSISLVVGDAFTDPGATANDNLDGNITTDIVVDGTVDVSTVGSYTLTYNVTDAAGNVACEVTRTVNVLASPDLTPPDITLNGADTITLDICQSFVDPGATAIDDIDGDISNSIVVTNNIVSGQVGTFTVEYDVTDGAGNAADTEVRVVILVNNPPTITLVGDATLNVEACSDFVDPGVIAYDNCLGILTPTISSNVDINTPGNYTITYEVTDGVNPAIVETRDVVVSPDVTSPEITLLGDNPTYVYLGDAYTEEGATADDNCDGNLDASINIDDSDLNTSARGSYVVTYTVTDAAGNQATKTRTVIVNTEPEARFGFTISGGQVSFTDSSLYSPTSWLWEFSDGTQNSNQNPTKTHFQSGNYSVCLTASNMFGSSDPTCEEYDVAVGINDGMLVNAFALYPNPTRDRIFIELISSEVDYAYISAYNMLGEQIRTKEKWDFTDLSNATYSMNLSGLAEGVYFIKIETEDAMITHRIVLLD